jgi:hypothetical protein
MIADLPKRSFSFEASTPTANVHLVSGLPVGAAAFAVPSIALLLLSDAVAATAAFWPSACAAFEAGLSGGGAPVGRLTC